jgi:hypothetical protein
VFGQVAFEDEEETDHSEYTPVYTYYNMYEDTSPDGTLPCSVKPIDSDSMSSIDHLLAPPSGPMTSSHSSLSWNRLTPLPLSDNQDSKSDIGGGENIFLSTANMNAQASPRSAVELTSLSGGYGTNTETGPTQGARLVPQILVINASAENIPSAAAAVEPAPTKDALRPVNAESSQSQGANFLPQIFVSDTTEESFTFSPIKITNEEGVGPVDVARTSLAVGTENQQEVLELKKFSSNAGEMSNMVKKAAEVDSESDDEELVSLLQKNTLL